MAAYIRSIWSSLSAATRLQQPIAAAASAMPCASSSSSLPSPLMQAWSSIVMPRRHINVKPAQDLINQVAPVEVNAREVWCDGGRVSGHPRIFINLDKPGPQVCNYCGLRYVQAHGHGHGHEQSVSHSPSSSSSSSSPPSSSSSSTAASQHHG